MKRLFFISCLMFMVINAMAYQPMLAEGRIWNVLLTGIDPLGKGNDWEEVVYYKIEGDSVIDGDVYKRVYESQDKIDWVLKYLMMENVKNLVGKQFKPDFDAWLKRLEHLGYNTYWKVLNAKSCGIPQNRERVFMISVLDCSVDFEFPSKQELKTKLGDLLEENVDEKYFLSNKLINCFYAIF